MSLFDRLNQRKIEDENLQKRIYTQLAKDGKFDELPDTCEFSEAVELEVWDKVEESKITKNVIGKFKGRYIGGITINNTIIGFNNAQLPTPKIDFSQFKTGDVVEVETISVGYMYGYIREVESDKLLLSLGYMSDVLRTIRKEKIKSITKIK